MAMAIDIKKRLEQKQVVLIDGAMGTELQRRGAPMHDEVWSAAALLTHPEIVRAVHEDYARAGAEVHITNTFSTAPHIIERSRLDATSRALNRIAVRMAREGIEQAAPAHDVFLAGSISTAVWSRNRERLKPAELRASFTEQAESLAEAGCDLLALEMMLTHDFSMDLDFQPEIVALAAATGLPVWVGISAKLAGDGALMLYEGPEGSAGRLEQAIAAVVAGPVHVAGIMHSEVPVMGPALTMLGRHWHGPIAVYPHSGVFVWPEWQHHTVMPPEPFVEAALGWVTAGAKAVGGCCGIGPAHIRKLHARLRSA
jgi:homocysteine S-methyltransferase